MRKMLTEIIQRDGSLKVAGCARDGRDALAKVEALKPDVITLDIEMPVMDGYATLVELMKQGPKRVVMISSVTQSGADITLRCLAAGAIDFVAKPSGSISLDLERVAAEIVAKIKIAAASSVKADAIVKPRPSIGSPLEAQSTRLTGASAAGILIVGASTGGPRALHTLVAGLGTGLRIPGIIVQHMPAGFTQSLAKRLNDAGGPRVVEAADGEALRPGTLLVAPGGHHLTVRADSTVQLSAEPPVHGVRPSIDVTLDSIAHTWGKRAIAVLLTGMGKDGARGMKVLRDMGARTFAEDESTCVVFGMPKAAWELQAVQSLLPLPELAPAILSAASETLSAAA